MNLQHWPTTAFKWSLIAVAGVWLKLPRTLPALLVFMCLDFITGLLAAFVKRELHSGESFRGIVKKSLILLLVITVHLASKMAGSEIGFSYDLGSLVAMAYIVNELISITENCAHAGVPVPQLLVDALAKVKAHGWSPGDPERRTDENPRRFCGRERREGR